MNLFRKIKAISKFKSSRDLMITYEELKKIPMSIPIEINEERPGSVITWKIYENEHGISFRVFMKKGEIWNIHHHDCDETLIVYKGELEGLISGKIATRNQFVEFKKNTSHLVRANKECIFYVEFKNPQV